MSIHITFNHMKNSEAVTSHIHDLMDELLKITDNKFPFHINMTKNSEDYHVVINCNFRNKQLTAKIAHENLYKALAKGVDAMKVQVIRKSERLRNN